MGTPSYQIVEPVLVWDRNGTYRDSNPSYYYCTGELVSTHDESGRELSREYRSVMGTTRITVDSCLGHGPLRVRRSIS